MTWTWNELQIGFLKIKGELIVSSSIQKTGRARSSWWGLPHLLRSPRNWILLRRTGGSSFEFATKTYHALHMSGLYENFKMPKKCEKNSSKDIKFKKGDYHFWMEVLLKARPQPPSSALFSTFCHTPRLKSDYIFAVPHNNKCTKFALLWQKTYTLTWKEIRLNSTWVYLESKSAMRTPSIKTSIKTSSKQPPSWYVCRLASKTHTGQPLNLVWLRAGPQGILMPAYRHIKWRLISKLSIRVFWCTALQGKFKSRRFQGWC